MEREGVRDKEKNTVLEFEQPCRVTACPAHTFDCTVRQPSLKPEHDNRL